MLYITFALKYISKNLKNQNYIWQHRLQIREYETVLKQTVFDSQTSICHLGHFNFMLTSEIQSGYFSLQLKCFWLSNSYLNRIFHVKQF